MLQRKFVIVLIMLLFTFNMYGQSVSTKLDTGVQKLLKDEQFKHAQLSLYVVDGITAKVVFDYNGQLGLSPASCQKVITSVSAFEMLGKGYQYKTYVGYDQYPNDGVLKSNLIISGNGDPTLGSQRWTSTSEQTILAGILNILRKNKIRQIEKSVIADDIGFTTDPLPNGWVWEDMGNYYGAGAWGLNWRENQFDITFKTGKTVDDIAEIVSTKPAGILKEYVFTNFVTTGPKGSGDNGYLFSAPFHRNIIARGTVPISDKGFTISGSIPDPPAAFAKALNFHLKDNGIIISGQPSGNSGNLVNKKNTMAAIHQLDSILSPTLDSINYWFLKKSVNLFGEAMVKTIAFVRSNIGSTDTGLAIIKEFWSKRGIDKSAIKIIDGSGLSPANKVTTHSLVTVLQYAKAKVWFPSFYNALPVMNGMRIKDGYISGVRSYAGYIKTSSGKEYTFSFIVNNFDGNAGTVRKKMLDLLTLIDN